jgi:Ser-tRNA(Ala) deacylase AlaX
MSAGPSVRKLFWEDPYRTHLEDVRVRTVEGATVTVDRTIFYAFSGGQESDAGTIGGEAVARAEKREFDIVYTLANPDHALRPGDITVMSIDWDRRYKLMRLHFAAELVLELMYRKCSGVEKIGAHIAADKARIDFQWAQSVSPLLGELTAEAMEIIVANRPIVSAFSDESLQRRYWEVAGFSQVPCGGTHLKRTGEVGPIRLKRDNVGKGKERVNIYLVDAVNA